MYTCFICTAGTKYRQGSPIPAPGLRLWCLLVVRLSVVVDVVRASPTPLVPPPKMWMRWCCWYFCLPTSVVVDMMLMGLGRAATEHVLAPPVLLTSGTRGMPKKARGTAKHDDQIIKLFCPV